MFGSPGTIAASGGGDKRGGYSVSVTNCSYRWAYLPPLASSSACVPRSMMRPWSTTRMMSARWIVLRRCATTKVVRPSSSRSSETWMTR